MNFIWKQHEKRIALGPEIFERVLCKLVTGRKLGK